MPVSREKIGDTIDTLIRLFFYILVFWLPYSSAVIESCVITAVILWIVKRFILNGFRIKALMPPDSALNKAIYFFVAICTLSVAGSILWQQSLADLITKVLEWFAVFWLIQEAFKNKRQVFILLGIFLFSAFATALDGIFQYHIWGKDIFNNHPVSPDGRATASFKAPSGLGALMATTIPLTLSMLFWGWKREKKIGVLVVAVLMMWALMLTFTRGAWTGAFVGILFFFFCYLIWQKQFEMFKTCLLAFVFLCLTVFFPLLLNTKTTLEMVKRSNTIGWRLDVWEDTWKMVKDRPVIGHGVNTYMPIFQAYRRDPHNHPTYAHNCYVQLAAEVGLLGLAAFLWIFTKFFWEGKKDFPMIENDHDLAVLSLGLYAAVVAFLVHSFFDTNLYALQLGVLLWFLVGTEIKINSLNMTVENKGV